MDDKDEFGFDWKETPDKEHPGGRKNCKCPRHEAYKEMSKTGIETMNIPIRLKLCPPHYKLHMETKDDLIAKESLKIRILYKIFARFLVKVVELTYMQSDLCFMCKFGSGGREKKTELPPI